MGQMKAPLLLHGDRHPPTQAPSASNEGFKELKANSKDQVQVVSIQKAGGAGNRDTQSIH